ncbi:hypothetical protein ACSBR2_004384 [Camellia fascicularis]
MDDTGTTSSRKKGKPQRFWNRREELFLITTMKDVTASNPRWKLDNNQFRVGFYNECEKKILSAFPGTDLRASPHIDSKIKLWRKQYNTLQDMLNINVIAMKKEDANATTEEGEQSPIEQFRARPAKGIPIELSKMAKNLGSFIENTNTTMVEIAHRIGYSLDLSQQRRLVNAELLKLPMSNTQRLMTASVIVKDEDKVDLFFSLDENDKMEWVSLLLEGHI